MTIRQLEDHCKITERLLPVPGRLNKFTLNNNNWTKQLNKNPIPQESFEQRCSTHYQTEEVKIQTARSCSTSLVRALIRLTRLSSPESHSSCVESKRSSNMQGHPGGGARGLLPSLPSAIFLPLFPYPCFNICYCRSSLLTYILCLKVDVLLNLSHIFWLKSSITWVDLSWHL